MGLFWTIMFILSLGILIAGLIKPSNILSSVSNRFHTEKGRTDLRRHFRRGADIGDDLCGKKIGK